MDLKAAFSSLLLLLAMVKDSSSRRLPAYTLRRGDRAARSDIAAREKNGNDRHLSDEEEIRARSMAYQNCGKDSGKGSGKDSGKGNGKGGKDGSRALYACLDYGDPGDDPAYFGPTPSPTADNIMQSLTGSDASSTPTPTDDPALTPVPLPAPPAPPLPTPPAPFPVAPAPGPVPTPGVSGLRGNSGSNQSLDVSAPYNPYVPSGSNDRVNDDSDTQTRTGDGEAGGFITLPELDETELNHSDHEEVPSNDGPM